MKEISGSICFSEQLLELISVKGGSDSENSSFSHHVEESPDCRKLVVNVRFDKATPAENLLATLRFKVQPQATPGQTTELKGEFAVTTAGGPLPARLRGGSVQIAKRPLVFACFLYMH
ncbi:MAG: hypothetical protein HY645_04810 [Acidobacteria bacterium]|nr:hypothetical protein [Acidobacteriota bacterium]